MKHRLTWSFFVHLALIFIASILCEPLQSKISRPGDICAANTTRRPGDGVPAQVPHDVQESPTTPIWACNVVESVDERMRNSSEVFLRNALSILLTMQDKPVSSPKGTEIKLNLKNVSLAEVVKSMEVKLPFSLEGKMSVQIKVVLPLDGKSDLRKFTAEGAVQLTEFVLAGIALDEVHANLRYDDGKLMLTSLEGRINPDGTLKGSEGKIRGSGHMQIDPPGAIRADLEFDKVSLNKIGGLPADKLQGAVSGKIKVFTPGNQFQSLNDVEAEGEIRSEQLKVDHLAIEQIAASLRLKQGVLALTDLRAQLNGSPIRGSGEIKLRDDYPFVAKIDARDWDLGPLLKMSGSEKTSSFAVAGALRTDVVVQGNLEPFKIAVSGEATTRNLKINAFEISTANFHWQTDGKKVDLKDVDVALYGGKVTGTAVVPFDPKGAGEMDLRIRNLDAKPLAKNLRVPFSIDGHVDGVVKGTLPPTKDGADRTGTLNLDVTSSKMRVQNIPTEQLHGIVKYQSGVVDYKLEGKTLGGSFDLEGEIPGDAKPDNPKKAEPKKGRLNIRGIQLSRLAKAFDLKTAHGLEGVFNLEVNYTHDTINRMPEGRGVVRLTDVRWKDRSLADSLQGDIHLSEGLVQLRNFNGNLAQGSVEVQVRYYLRQPDRSWFTVTLENTEASQLLAPWLGTKIEGPIQARIRGNLGSSWRGTADLELSRGKVFGIDIAQWRVPATWTFAPAENRGSLDIHETSAQVGRGRATGKLNLAWEHAARIEGFLRLENADLQDLLRQTVGSSQLGGGQTMARFEFSGSEVRSLNDIKGKLVASFKQTQALQVPILDQITPYLGVGKSTTFQNGNLRARLDRGTFRIEQFTLQGPSRQVFAEGTASLEGRLDLAVVARTGDVGLPSVRLGPVSLRVPIAGPVPVALLVEASGLLSKHVIYLQVTGTASNPIIQPRPVPILSQEAVRYLLNRSSLPVTPNF